MLNKENIINAINSSNLKDQIQSFEYIRRTLYNQKKLSTFRYGSKHNLVVYLFITQMNKI